ncbi:MAG: universal stress protein [Oligoflexus sp.]
MSMLDLASHQSTIILGLSLKDTENYLLDTAIQIAKFTMSRLVISHIILPLQSYMHVNGEVLYSLLSYEKDIELLNEKRFISELEDIKKGIRDIEKHKVEVKVLHNEPALGLFQLAKEMKASLLICGYKAEKNMENLLGLSTAHALMSDPPCPVLALPLTKRFVLTGKVAFADDLQEESLMVLMSACEFMQILNLQNLYHMHIKNLTMEQLKHMEDTIHSAIMLGSIPRESVFSHQTYKEQMKEYLSQILRKRFDSIDPDVRKTIKCYTKVAFGSPMQKLKELIQEVEAELTVFGSHKFFHKTSWSFGNLPYRAMFSFDCGILLIPR